jgi:hypothetical protein
MGQFNYVAIAPIESLGQKPRFLGTSKFFLKVFFLRDFW